MAAEAAAETAAEADGETADEVAGAVARFRTGTRTPVAAAEAVVADADATKRRGYL